MTEVACRPGDLLAHATLPRVLPLSTTVLRSHYVLRMGKRRVSRLVPLWMATVGSMRDLGTDVRARCRKCATWFRVELDTLCTLRGRSYTLVGAKSRCKVFECDGQVIFYASPGPSTPLRPLLGPDPWEVEEARASDDEPPSRPRDAA